ncbi:nucleotide sugar dehydrogenase [Salinibacter sp.]|uniref:nucleotide sugar dehydrogenase n=1 Tax=Salinibacter sp. TaxID=2065818 RepID=UPI0021E9A091|nr:nucleotide sugar dehydrogenase [Salinibacter sp.]
MEFSASVVGLGNLGACLAASLAHGGISVRGVDVDEDVVRAFQDERAPYDEPDLLQYIREGSQNLRATTDYSVISETDVTFLFVNTPSRDDGGYSLESVRKAARSIGEQLAGMDDYHLVVLRSTVMPGTTTGELRDILENASGKTAGKDFGLCYCPEFTAVGKVISLMENPDFFLIGEYDERSGEVLSDLYREWVDEPSPVRRTDPVSAEIVKMAINTYVTTKISFANNLAQICDGIGGDVDEVTDIITDDWRINGNFFTAGTAYGGPCFPRDNKAFTALAEAAGTAAPLAAATDQVNRNHTSWIAKKVRDVTPPSGSVGILGMAFKPGVTSTRESQGRKLVSELQDEFNMHCYDSMGAEALRRQFNEEVIIEESIPDVISQASTVIITVRRDEYAPKSLYENNDVVVVDPWRFLEDVSENNFRHISLGSNNSS